MVGNCGSFIWGFLFSLWNGILPYHLLRVRKWWMYKITCENKRSRKKNFSTILWAHLRLVTINSWCLSLPKWFSLVLLSQKNEAWGSVRQSVIRRKLGRNYRTLARKRFKTDNMMNRDINKFRKRLINKSHGLEILLNLSWKQILRNMDI